MIPLHTEIADGWIWRVDGRYLLETLDRTAVEPGVPEQSAPDSGLVDEPPAELAGPIPVEELSADTEPEGAPLPEINAADAGTAETKSSGDEQTAPVPKPDEGILARAKKAWEEGSFETAQQMFEDAAQQSSVRIQALISLAQMALERGDLNQAQEHGSTLLEMGHCPAEVIYNLGVLYDEAAHPEAAVPFYRRALDLNPGLTQALVNLGYAESRSGNPAVAIELWRRALELDPALAWGYFELGP